VEIFATKFYSNELNKFYKRYTLDYCKQNKLFYKEDKRGELRNITRSLVNYADEIISTDYILITGTNLHVESDDSELKSYLNSFISSVEFSNMLNLYILQGLILGDTFIKFGVNDDGEPVLGVPRLDSIQISYIPYLNSVQQWNLYYTGYDEKGNTASIREEFTKTSTKFYINDKLVKNVPHQYGDFMLIHVINKPSLRDNIFGDSELDVIYSTIDEINSTLSRMSTIEDIYAKPRFIISGLRDAKSFVEDDNMWAVPDGATVSILEYQGDVMPSMLQKVKYLEDYLKAKNPELMLSEVKESTGYALRLKLLKLVKKIEAYKKNYYNGLKRALRLVALYKGYDSDFSIYSDDIIPNDILEDVQRFAQMINMGILSKQTASERLGINYELEQERINQDPPQPISIVVPNNSQRGNGGKTEVRSDEKV